MPLAPRPITGLTASLNVEAARGQFFEVYQGDDFVLNFTGDSTLGDISTYSLLYIQRGYINGALVTLLARVGAIVSGPARTFTVTFTGAATAGIPAGGGYEWEIRRTNLGNQDVIASGVVAILAASPTSVITSKVHFSVVPSTATPTAGIPLSVVVTALNDTGGTVTDYSDLVHLNSSDGQAILGPDSLLASGVGTFAVTLKTAGVQTIQATGLTDGATGTASLTVGPATAATLAVYQQPANVLVGSSIAPPVIFSVLDTLGNLCTSSTASVTVVLTVPGSANLTGTLTVSAVAGMAVFSNLVVDLAGTYTLTASSPGLTPVTSSGFNVSGLLPSAVAFLIQPANVNEDAVMAVFTVRVVDSGGNLVSSATNAITVGLTVAAGATLGGTVTRNAVSGVATFNDIVVDTPGTFSLTASASGLTPATSSSFNVSALGYTFRHQPNSTWGEGLTVVTDASNNIYFGGTAQLGSALSIPFVVSQFHFAWSIARYNSGGTVDTTWGDFGYAYLTFGDTATATDNELTSILPLASGKVLVAGIRTNRGGSPSTFVAVARLNHDGTLDTIFGTSGYTQINTGGAYTDVAFLGVQSSGKIIVGFPNVLPGGAPTRYEVWRMSAAGVIDTSFGSSGKTDIRYDSGQDAFLGRLKVLSNDKIVLTGYTATGVGSQLGMYTAQLNSDGSPDSSFGGVGVDSNGVVTTFAQDLNVFAADIIVQSDNKIVIVGQCAYDSSGKSQCALVRYSSLGVIDTSYGTSGIALTDLHTQTGKTYVAPSAAVLLSNDKIQVAGVAVTPTAFTGFSDNGIFFAAQFTTTGALDTANYGAGAGFVTPTISGGPTSSEVFYTCVLTGGGKLLAGGHSMDDVSSPRRAVPTLFRLTSTGAVDTLFGDPPGVGFPASPSPTTGGSSSVTGTSATIAGTVSGNDTYHFDYGTSPDYGAKTADVAGTGAVTANLTSLTAGQTYHYRLAAKKTTDGVTSVALGADATFDTVATLLPALVGYWKGDNANDSTTNAYNLTNNGSVTFTSGGPSSGNGTAFTFGGSNYLSRASNADLQTGANDWTWAGWIKPTDLSANYGFAGKGIYTSNNFEWTLWYWTGGNSFVLSTGNPNLGTQENNVWSSTISSGTLYFVVVQYDATQNKTYISVNHGTPHALSLTIVPTAGNGDYVIGFGGTGSNKAIGQIAECGFWKSAPGGGGLLSTNQIGALYAAGAGLTWPLP